MPATQVREINASERLANLRYAIRDLAVTADNVVKQGHKVLYLNVGDPNIFDFVTPAHVVEAAARDVAGHIDVDALIVGERVLRHDLLL